MQMRCSEVPQYSFPDGAKYAFTIIDDTDVATVANVLPVYRQLFMRFVKKPLYW